MSPITATPKTGRGGAGARRGSRGRVCGAARAGPGRLQLCHRSVEWARYDRNLARCKKNLQRAWSEASWRIARLRGHPACADEEYGALLDARDPGLTVHLSFNPEEDIAAPF